MINNLFRLLDDWRHLPAYQLERRADIFFALYLNDIIAHAYPDIEKIDLIIPEFPLRVGNVQDTDSNQSFRIDYLLYSASAKRCFLIELKTDMNSLDDGQFAYLKAAAAAGLYSLMDGVISIYKATKQKKKYRYLLEKLADVGWLKINTSGKDLSVENLLNATSKIELSFVYIQPSLDEKPIEGKEIITFQNIIDCLKDKNDGLSERFSASLKKWAEKKAGDAE